MISPIFHPASGNWMLGSIENHTAKPMSYEEISAHLADYHRLRQLCEEQSAALKWARELMAQREDPQLKTEN